MNIEPIVTLMFSLLEIIKNAVLDLGLDWVIVLFDICQLSEFT